MNKTSTILIAWTTALLCLVGLSFAPLRAEPNNPPRIVYTKPTLRVAIYKGSDNPFVQYQEQSFSGFDIDMVKRIAAYLGVTIKYVPVTTSYNDIITLVAEDQADIGLSALSRTLTRGLSVRFSRPYFNDGLVLFVALTGPLNRANEAAAVQYINVHGGQIGMIQTTAFTEVVNTLFPKAQIRVFDTAKELFSALRQGDIIAGIDNQHAAALTLSRHPSSAIFIRRILLQQKDSFSIVSAYQDKYFGQWLDLFIDLSLNDGFIAQLEKRYLG